MINETNIFADPAASVYTCEFCRSTYSHPGNFKQHLGKHERETGCVSSAYDSGYLGPSNDIDAAIIHSAARKTAKPPTVSRHPPTSFAAEAASANLSSGANSHLSNVLREAIQ